MAKIRVKNRSNGTAGYTIPELGDKRNITRVWGPGELKFIDKEEIEALTYIGGGTKLLEEFLQILEKDVAEEIINNVEVEYNMSEDDIKDLLLNGSDDALRDCLDFAPVGVIDLVKKYAVSLPVNSATKREIIREQLGYDVDKILINLRAEGAEQTSPQPKKQRRVPVTPASEVAASLNKFVAKDDKK